MAIFDKVDYIEIEHAQLFVMLGSRVFRNDPRVIKNVGKESLKLLDVGKDTLIVFSWGL